MSFNGSATKLNFRVVSGSQPRFLAGVKFEISHNPAGSQFFEVEKAKVKGSGKKLQTRGDINEQEVGVFFPDGDHRVLRFTNPTCGTTILRVKRMGDLLVVDAGLQEGTPIWQ
jgi:hypothetical protein